VRLGQKHDAGHAVARAEAVEVAVQYARAFQGAAAFAKRRKKLSFFQAGRRGSLAT